MANHFAGISSSSDTDCYGFKKPEEFDEESHQEFLSGYLPVLAKRSKRWDTLLPTENGSSFGRPDGLIAERKLKRFIRKGVPTSLRPKVWMAVSGSDERCKAHPGEYANLCKVTAAQDAEDAIDLDLNRTFPDNEYFKNFSGSAKEQLKRVLHAIAVKHSEIGYCQGLNYIAGMLLLVVKNEENAFCLLESILMEVPDYYSPGMKGLKTDIAVLHELIRERSPELDGVFKKFDFDLLLVTSKWFLCWFMETLPIETVLRVWDCLFHEGPKILFRVAITLIIRNKQTFAQCTSMASIMDVFKTAVSDPNVINCHKFMEDIFVAPGTLSGKTIEQLRKKYSKMI